MTIYLDSLFFVNLFMDSSILYLVKMFTKTKSGLLRVMSGAVILAFYGTGMVIDAIGFLYNAICMIAVPMIIVRFAFGKEKFIKSAAVFWLSSFGLGGVMYGIMHMSDLTNLYVADLSLDTSVYYIEVNPIIGILGCLILYIIMIIIEKTAVRNFSKDKLLIDGEMLYKGKRVVFRCLADTGCSATEPISGRPLLIIEKRVIDNVYDDLSPDTYIYTKGINQTVRLPVIYPDLVVGRSKKYSIICDIPVALTDNILCRDGLYNGIINPDGLLDLSDNDLSDSELSIGFKCNLKAIKSSFNISKKVQERTMIK